MASNTISNLSLLPIGTTAIVQGFADDFLAEKLLELGVIPGEAIEVHHRTAFGDPMLVAIAGCRLSLRKNEAEAVLLSIQ